METAKTYTGLTTQQAQKHLKEYGRNIIDADRDFSIFKLLFSQYFNILTGLLFVAGVFALLIGEVVDAFFIILVIVLNGLFGFFQEFRAEKTLEKLKDLVVQEISVLRNGEEVSLSVDQLVPEDVMLIREGDKIPADGELVSKGLLEVDESIFTGESLPVEKKMGDLLLAGTFVLRGQGKVIVGATGLHTKLGQIAQEMKKLQKPKTPLAENLTSLGRKLAVAAVAISILLIPVGLFQGRELRELLLTTISLSVAVIPEGLPLVVTVALAVGAYRMMQKNTIVRKMSSIETLGATTVILSDKTGTLTQNQMRVKKHWLVKEDSLSKLIRACVVGNSANLALEKNGEEFDVLGDKTDGALLLFAHNRVSDIDDFRAEGEIIEEKPFDSETKIIETVWKDAKGREHTFFRGAPESILKLITSVQHEKIEEHVEKLAKEGLRVIGFAVKESGKERTEFIGLVGIYDAPRLEAKNAIEEAQKAGIKVVMVTGDNPVTAFAIAKEIGLMQEKELVITTDELAKLTNAQLLETLPRVRVFARMKPEDKLRLVRLYKEAGAVVAVTGDGVNDSLALTESNIGVAMGREGTDVAKEAADMIITDDNLATIVKAVEEGRNIYHNITQVVIYLIASNAAEFLTVFVGIMLNLPIPLTATQILWINLVSDGIPALALATDVKKGKLLAQKPRNIREQIVNASRTLTILKIAVPLSLFIIALFAMLLQIFPESTARLILFNVFVICEMMVVFVVRGSLFPLNKLLMGSVVVSLLLQVALMLFPLTRSLFS